MEMLSQNGSGDYSKDFRPGMNFFVTDGPVCISYVDLDGVQVSEFMLDTGNHRLRVPSRVKVFVECHDSVSWNVRNFSPHEVVDPTPVDVSVTKPNENYLKDQVKNEVLSIMARYMGVKQEQLESPEDAEDFDMDDDDDMPATFSELAVMAEDLAVQQSAKSKHPHAEPSITVDEEHVPQVKAKPVGKVESDDRTVVVDDDPDGGAV